MGQIKWHAPIVRFGRCRICGGHQVLADQTVGEGVPPEVAVPPEDLSTGIAVVRFDVRVSQEMSLEVAALVEGSAAGWTFVRTVFHVKDAVNGECAGLAETFTTFAAFEGLFLRMNVPEKRKKIG